MTNRFTANYWTEKYKKKEIGWDVGEATTPFVELFKSLQDKDVKILIPGCGSGYEGELLFNLGFKNITLLDASVEAKTLFLQRVPSFPKEQFIIGDFFTVSEQFDLILEQTFFCALEPSLREDYATKMHDLLVPGGELIGLLFTFPLTEKGPPFGGSKQEYLTLFSKHFTIDTMEPCYNSISPRMGNELFICLKKPMN